MQAAKLSCTELDAALVKLQICGASQQLETQAGYLWAACHAEDEFVEDLNPEL